MAATSNIWDVSDSKLIYSIFSVTYPIVSLRVLCVRYLVGMFSKQIHK